MHVPASNTVKEAMEEVAELAAIDGTTVTREVEGGAVVSMQKVSLGKLSQGSTVVAAGSASVQLPREVANIFEDYLDKSGEVAGSVAVVVAYHPIAQHPGREKLQVESLQSPGFLDVDLEDAALPGKLIAVSGLKDPIEIALPKSTNAISSEGRKTICIAWNGEQWSNSGVYLDEASSLGGQWVCKSSHLTTFAVISAVIEQSPSATISTTTVHNSSFSATTAIDIVDRDSASFEHIPGACAEVLPVMTFGRSTVKAFREADECYDSVSRDAVRQKCLQMACDILVLLASTWGCQKFACLPVPKSGFIATMLNLCGSFPSEYQQACPNATAYQRFVFPDRMTEVASKDGGLSEFQLVVLLTLLSFVAIVLFLTFLKRRTDCCGKQKNSAAGDATESAKRPSRDIFESGGKSYAEDVRHSFADSAGRATYEKQGGEQKPFPGNFNSMFGKRGKSYTEAKDSPRDDFSDSDEEPLPTKPPPSRSASHVGGEKKKDNIYNRNGKPQAAPYSGEGVGMKYSPRGDSVDSNGSAKASPRPSSGNAYERSRGSPPQTERGKASAPPQTSTGNAKERSPPPSSRGSPPPQTFGARRESGPQQGPSARSTSGPGTNNTPASVAPPATSQGRTDDVFAVNAELTRMRNAGTSLAERKKFFNQQCLRWHPDKNPEDSEHTKAVFQHLQEKKAWFLAESVESVPLSSK